jgi:putative membrane-bound dehydrogenase-like protein
MLLTRTRLALVLVVLLGLLSVLVADKPGDKPLPKTNIVRLNGHNFTLPDGFTIELVAGPPLVNRPITADFDEEGRLYVSDSSGSNEPVKVQLEKKPHRIVRLEDTKGDGKFDRATVFADKLMFPAGTMWFDGSLYVSAPPSIWKLTDTDGDGVADKREEWFQGKTLTGCANDLHGPYRGPDGWIYWCKGAFAEQKYERPGKKPFVTKAAHIFRSRPDGTCIEPVMTGGMDNPVDVVFTPGGERIFTTTFLQHPAGGKRDGLIHAVYGGVWGKDHNVIEGHPRTSPDLMPVLSHLGAAAPAGLHRYESTEFGAEYRNNLFACLFNMHKVTRHVLTPQGATFKTTDSDFLVSDNLDFHPTDVIEDADGSLLVIDTGGWYKLCCPTSQLVKPDVLGGIYRIRRTGAHKIDDPRGRKIDWAKARPDELVKRLDDPRPVVRRRAIEELARRGESALDSLTELLSRSKSAEARQNAVWTLTRIDQPKARDLARKALSDTDETVRHVALYSVSLWRDAKSVDSLRTMLKTDRPSNRRIAAEALGRIGDRAVVPALLDALTQKNDPVLDHSLTFALIEIGDRESTAVGLQHSNPQVRRAALVALDQMTDGGLDVKTVAAELNSPNVALRESAAWVAGHHPDWGEALSSHFADYFSTNVLTADQRDVLASQVARFARNAAIQRLLAEQAKRGPNAKVALRAMAQSGLKEMPEVWIAALVGILGDTDSAICHEAIAVIRSIPPPKSQVERVADALRKVGENAAFDDGLRLTALAAVPGGLASLTPAQFEFLRKNLDREQPLAVRSPAAEVLSKARLTAEQLIKLTQSLKVTGPLEIDRLIDAFAASDDEKVGTALLAALNEPAVRSSLRSETLKPRLKKYPASVQKEAETMYAVLDADLIKQRAKLETLLESVKSGDIRRGQAVFQSPRAGCASCHAIGYLGGTVGPDLTRVGQIRSERDLLESIVFPSASIVRSYEPVLITTKAGKSYNGLVRKDSADEVILQLNAEQQVRIARADIEEMLPSKVSIMPAGLDQQLSPQELADLVAFLKACR